MKLVALYKPAADPQAFDAAYFETHLPLIREVPGLLGVRVSRISRSLMGEDLYMMAEMSFSDLETLKQALRSPEMQAAGENLNSFAAGLTTLVIAEEM
jgi:uncharacterized protein (TIGR02118 family)